MAPQVAPETSIPIKPLAATMSTPSRVVVVEPNGHTRLHFKRILQPIEDFDLAGDFPKAKEALTAVARLQPDLMLLGVQKNDLSGIKCIGLFKRILTSLKIIVVLGTGNMDFLDSALQAGADGCLVKPVSAGQCLATLRFAEHSRNKIEPHRPKSRSELSSGATAKSCVPLSPRENEVMAALAEGLLYKEIADKMGISYSTVHKYQQNIFRKYHVVNRSEAIRVWSHSDILRDPSSPRGTQKTEM